ncbi:hypothetical protein [Rugosimonospora africana]|nr:hypothetical protein [Rugosimonospora africana]
MISSKGAGLGEEAAQRLAQLGCCRLAPGLTDAEFDRLEREYDIEFADDHRSFLATGVPTNTPFEKEEGVFHAWERPWPEWRDGNPDLIRQRLDWPVEGILFDVEHNAYWHGSWGDRPKSLVEALETARSRLARVPKLVPIYGHRFLPGGRGTFGHPVLSVWQTDIIYYGMDLIDYVHQEFGGPGTDRMDERWQPLATVDFWKDFL